MSSTPLLRIHGQPIYDASSPDQFTINHKFPDSSLQECADTVCDEFAKQNRRSGMKAKGYDECPDSGERFINIHGVSINTKANDQGQPEYFVSLFEEDLSNLQEAVDTACGLFCLQYGLIDNNGDPSLEVAKEIRLPGRHEIKGADSLLEADDEVILLFNGKD